MTQKAIEGSLNQKRRDRAIQQLGGILLGITADGVLHDHEIKFLRAWLTDNSEISSEWPGSVIAMQIDTVLEDGVVTPEERAYLLKSFNELTGAAFAETGAVTPEPTGVFDDDVRIDHHAAVLCFTGEFSYGTRSACAKLAEKAGAKVSDTINRRVTHLVVGSRVAPDWKFASYGRKIEQAQSMRTEGRLIAIVRERNWIQAIELHGGDAQSA